MRFLTLLFCLVLAVPAQAQSNKTEAMAVLARLHADAGAAKYVRQKMGLTGERQAIMLAHVQELFANKSVRAYAANQFLSGPEDRLEVNGAMNSLAVLSERGIVHLSTAEMLFQAKVMRAMLAGMPASRCGQTIKGQVAAHQAGADTGKAMQRMTPKTLQEFMRIERRAIVAGLTRKAPPQISYAVRDRVSKRIAENMFVRMGLSGSSTAIARAMENLPQASDAMVCKAVLMMMDSNLDITGSDQRAALVMFFE